MNEEEKKTTPGTVENEGKQNVRVCDCDKCKERMRQEFCFGVLSVTFFALIVLCITYGFSVVYSNSCKKSEERDYTNAVQIWEEEKINKEN